MSGKREKFDKIVFVSFLLLTSTTALVALNVTLVYGIDSGPPSGVSVWSADFESGDQGAWNWYAEQQPQNAIISVSSQTINNGGYSGYYYYLGNPNGKGDSIRAYPSEILDPRPATFYVQFWVYVPSVVNGQQVKIANWVSFASLWLNSPPAYPWNGPSVNPITIDSFTNQQLALWLGPLKTSSGPSDPYYVYQTNPITWPFDKWFSIGVFGIIQPAGNSSIIVYQNGVQIIKYVGNLGADCTGLGQMHYGLYADPAQATIAFYNDDINVFVYPLQVTRRS